MQRKQVLQFSEKKQRASNARKKHGGSIDTTHLSRSVCINIRKQKQYTRTPKQNSSSVINPFFFFFSPIFIQLQALTVPSK